MDLTKVARTIFASALMDCTVEQAFSVKLVSGVGDNPFALRWAGDKQTEIIADLSGTELIVVIAAGKGAVPMLQGLLRTARFPSQAQLSGVLIAPERPNRLPDGIAFIAGGHPLPTSASFAGARAALSLIETAIAHRAKVKTFCFFLISGGASAMMELPLDESISLADTKQFYSTLVHSGATIAEINSLRKHFSAVKGGRLGQMAAGLPNMTILVSDVPATQLDALASGLTIPDSSTVTQCLEIIQRYRLVSQLPPSVRNFFTSVEIPETPKPGVFPTHIVTLLSSDDLAEAARRKAESLGYTAVVDNACDEWDYRFAAEHLLTRFRELRRQRRRVCLISVGEVTVRLLPETADGKVTDEASGRTGVGGRNQHFALHTAALLQPQDGRTVVLSAASDGIDGNSPFAGAVLDCGLLRKSRKSAAEALERFDSSTYLSDLQAVIETGPTGNNLRDLRLLLNE